jgi:hypothetical protein
LLRYMRVFPWSQLDTIRKAGVSALSQASNEPVELLGT